MTYHIKPGVRLETAVTEKKGALERKDETQMVVTGDFSFFMFGGIPFANVEELRSGPGVIKPIDKVIIVP
ncbi:hypothetical protein A2160_00090 [Candidatus Beckwithbacteria bacterium RBG_13_42_9]|uniref:Uncharacterized protein n=1 Tax=Candidatus Beckwithbacteria bacterium RBG_13_42_9 TaxID=1797457 RepID=A0A1F5E566_9BACT|nr:MAG: hypothetical protein A2160_00090 [Candidatus Beckwithbacteria bacterium RBG_13_42_9]